MEIFKIIAIAIVTCFLAIIVKNIKECYKNERKQVVLCQRVEHCETLAEMLKKEGISTCIETNASLKDTEKLIDIVDYMIADFKSPNKEFLKSITGADIETIKENLLKRALTQKYLLIRIPLINNFNTGIENARDFCEFFKELTQKSKNENIFIEILTYHEYGKDKYKKENL